MTYQQWAAHYRVQQSEAFRELVATFRHDADAVWHIDRHVFDVDFPSFSDASTVEAGVRAGFTLLRTWKAGRDALITKDPFISSPVLVVDDLWLAGGSQTPPPHVLVCLAKSDSDFVPVRFVEGCSPGEPSMLARMAAPHERIARVNFEGASGGLWIVETEPDTVGRVDSRA